MIEADRLLAERLQIREREVDDEEKGKLFMELIEKRRKHFVALRAQEKRNRPPTKAQKRSQMSTYLKHNKVGTNTKQLMDKERYKSNEKKVEGSEEKAKSSRKKSLVRKEAVKEHNKISKDTRTGGLIKETGHLIRADGSSKRHSSMIRLLQCIDREDLQTLWKLVKTKHGDLRPEDEHERVLWGDLKVMFEPDIRSDVWRNLQGYKVGDEAILKELGDRMERAATTASSLEAEQDSGSGPRCQDTILGDVDAQTWFETTSKQFNDPPLSKVNTFGSGEDSMQLMELMAHCTKLCEFVRKKNREKCTIEDGVHAITTAIDGRDKIITEASIRRHLKLQDSEGLSSLPNVEIFEQLARMGAYSTPTLTNKLFNNMRIASKGYSRVVTQLFDTMPVQPQGEAPSTSPSRITSSPSLSSHHTPPSTPNTPPSFQTTHEAEETATMPHDSPLPGGHTPGSDKGRLKHDELIELVTKLLDSVVAVEEDLKQTKKTYSTALTKLVLKVKKLEKQVRSGKARRRDRIVLSEDKDAAEDPSKQRRKIAQIDTYPTISLVQDEGTSWFQEDVETQEKNSADTEVLLEEETPTELIEDLGSSEKGEKEISTTDVQEEEQAKAMAEQEQERINFEAALELQRQLDERDEVPAEATQSQTIDWSDHVVLRYHALQNRPYSVAEVRNIQVGGKDFEVYKLTRADGSASYHGNIQAFLRILDREDLSTLYRLVQERFQYHPLEGRGKINMLVEKKYPLIKDLLEKMLNLQLEAEEESTMAFELLKFIKSQIEEQ
ncbi:hypothetical protein Tco_0243086 [Tanacetum coccineum]